MKSNRHFIKDFVQNPIHIGVILASCLLGLVFGSMVWGENSSFNKSESFKQQATFLSANDFLSDIHYLLQFPFEGDAPEEQESENESNKTVDEDSENFNQNASFALKAGFNSEKSLFSQLNLSNHNRTRISLIILHHSWKSFLV